MNWRIIVLTYAVNIIIRPLIIILLLTLFLATELLTMLALMSGNELRGGIEGLVIFALGSVACLFIMSWILKLPEEIIGENYMISATISNKLTGLLIIVVLLGLFSVIFFPVPSEISNQNISPQFEDMKNRSWTEEDREDWVILSKTELVSGLHLKKVFARRHSDNFVYSIFTEKEHPINAHVKVAWVHHRMSYSTKQDVVFPIILMRCN